MIIQISADWRIASDPLQWHLERQRPKSGECHSALILTGNGAATSSSQAAQRVDQYADLAEFAASLTNAGTTS